MTILEVDKLTKVYGSEWGQVSVKAISNINFTVEKGELIGIMSPSRSGKITLLNVISGIAKPTSDYVKISNRNINVINSLAIFGGDSYEL